MPFNGSGTFAPPAAPTFPAVAGTAIVAASYNSVINDIVTAFNNTLTRDGQGKPSANIDWNSKNLTGVATLGAVTGTISGNATIGGTLGVTGVSTLASLVLGTPLVAQYGGTGVNGAAAANGALLIGNGAGFTLATLTAGSGVTINNTAGGIEIAASGGGAGTTTNALTIVNDGTGAASGSTFNGSAARTLSWNSVGALPNTPRMQAVVSAATLTPTMDYDINVHTAQAVNLAIANPTGTVINGWGMVIRLKDNGSARTISWGSKYRALGVTLPTTTVANKTVYIGCIYNAQDDKWDVTSVAQEV